ncbi:KGK domain-containing protein [Alkalinema pantanalense CENA528]|uniref:KGK domain-containing protein n=1 Tax=Alkalinema pantanalense TaxID=1620705 RepID=UPI003D6DE8B1
MSFSSLSFTCVSQSVQWVSGKVRLVLEFQPDEPEESVEAVPDSESGASPLDEIRQTISD